MKSLRLSSAGMDIIAIYLLAVLLRVIPDFTQPPHVTTDPDFWYYYMAAKEPAWFHQLYGAGQPLATTYFAEVTAFFSGLFHYSLAMTMKLGFALVDSASAAGLYLMGRRLYNRKAGILSGFAYAVSAQAIEGSSLKVRHDGFAVALVVFSGYILALLSTSSQRKNRLYYPISEIRGIQALYVLALLVTIYAAYLLTFYQLLVVVAVIGGYFALSEVFAYFEDKKLIHLLILALVAVLGIYAFVHYNVAYYVGWSASLSGNIMELAGLNLNNPLPWLISMVQWLNVFILFIPFGIYFAIKYRDAFLISLFLVTFPLYVLALRGLVYFIVPVAFSFGISLRNVRLRKTLAGFALIVAVINVGIYYDTFPFMIQAMGTPMSQYKAALWIKENSSSSSLVLANWDRGHLIQAVAERNVVWAGQYVPSIGLIVSRAMYSTNETGSLQYLRELGSPTYIFLVQGTLDYYPSEGLVAYITGIGSPPPRYLSNRTLLLTILPRTVLYRMLYEPQTLNDFRLAYSYGGVYVFVVNYTAANSASLGS
ncbi:MAG: hypothetical protein ACP5GO_06320 [Thermoprotei archaeon]